MLLVLEHGPHHGFRRVTERRYPREELDEWVACVGVREDARAKVKQYNSELVDDEGAHLIVRETSEHKAKTGS